MTLILLQQDLSFSLHLKKKVRIYLNGFKASRKKGFVEIQNYMNKDM